jgi:hypothetical protein
MEPNLWTSIFDEMCTKYLWWEPVGDEPHTEVRVIAQVMDIGDFFDVERLHAAIGDDRLREALSQAQPGWFSPRSWSYWHYRLGLVEPEEDVPPPPTRACS